MVASYVDFKEVHANGFDVKILKLLKIGIVI